MSQRRRLVLASLCALALARCAQALEWSKTEIAATPARGDEVVRAKYEFKNSSNQHVHILEVKTSCGCTEATPTSSDIAPGEAGAVYVLFTIGQRTGLQEKEITLLTDDAKVPVRLTLKVNLPPAAPEAVPAQK